MIGQLNMKCHVFKETSSLFLFKCITVKSCLKLQFIQVKHLTAIFGRDVGHVVSASLMNRQSSSGGTAGNANQRLQERHICAVYV